MLCVCGSWLSHSTIRAVPKNGKKTETSADNPLPGLVDKQYNVENTVYFPRNNAGMALNDSIH